MINLITKLLAFAYRREAAKFDRVSAKLIRVGKEQAEEATKLARRAEKALAESKDCSVRRLMLVTVRSICAAVVKVSSSSLAASDVVPARCSPGLTNP